MIKTTNEENRVTTLEYRDDKGNLSLWRVYVRDDGGMSVQTSGDSFETGLTWRGEKIKFSVELKPDGSYHSSPFLYRATLSPWDSNHYDKPKTLRDMVLGIAKEIHTFMQTEVPRLTREAKRHNLETELSHELGKLRSQEAKVKEAEERLKSFLNE